ncbi:DUF3267 domain-containing protein [Virgibacillus sp. C22-A2]|uniref:DUF3267 domain-containing protein n=1 Tax=Virgibacillus tibetensis TaxID=3042313 RepID=A0ABU6KFQ4_9BACI|nr:DUF3267 domain-containing protein [Virgibacillus sp. C22-A2]
MNCWKSINLTKEFGHSRLYIVSFLIGLLSFIFLYVPISIAQGTNHTNEAGFLPFIISLILLPTLHSLMHILPLILMKKRLKIIYKGKNKILPILNYYTKFHLTKKASLIVALAPTLLITIPGIAASYLFIDYSVYILLFTCVHIGITFIDFLYVLYIVKAPKKAFIENGNDGFDILIKSHS